MTTWKKSICCLSILPMLAFATPCSAADAAPPARESVVLNGHLNTSDFTGGVGYGASDGGYYYAPGSVYGSAPNNEFARTLAFIAAARNRALHGASMNGHSFGHR